MPSQWNYDRDGGLRLTLTGENNHTLEGTIHLQDPDLLRRLVNGIDLSGDNEVTTQAPRDDYDPKGASAYAIVVIFVYGFSIVLLIASHIFLKKKEDKKDGENEKEITKYLEQAPTLQRDSEKESFRKLKRSIIPLVSVGMLTAGANVRDGTPAGSARPHQQRERKESQRTRLGSQGSQRSNSEDDEQVAPLLSESPFSAKKPCVFEGDVESTLQLPSDPMPTIFEGAENESIKSQDEFEQLKDSRRLNDKSRWNQSKIPDQRYVPIVHTPRSNQYRPPTVRILESKRQNHRQVPKSQPTHYQSNPPQHNIVQCPRDLLNCDDEKLLQVTVL